MKKSGLVKEYIKEYAERDKHMDAYTTALQDDAYCDNWISENGLRILSNFNGDRPWHLVISFIDPHSMV